MANPTGFNDYIVNFLQPEHDWKLDESGTPIEDYGTATDSDLNIGGIGNTYQVAGDVTYETDYAIEFDGGTNARLYDSASVPQINHAQGSVMVIFTINAGVNASDIMFAVGGGSTATAMFFRHQTRNAGADDVLSLYITDTGNAYRRECFPHNAMRDGKFHMGIWVQPHDGTGMKIYIDGVSIPINSDQDVNEPGFDIDSWFDVNPTQGRNVIASHPATGNNTYDGKISRVFVTDEVLVQAQIDNLQRLRTHQNLVFGSNTRKAGRKFFTLGV